MKLYTTQPSACPASTPSSAQTNWLQPLFPWWRTHHAWTRPTVPLSAKKCHSSHVV